MDIEPLSIEGAIKFTPKLFGDERGVFSELFKAPLVAEAIGHSFNLAQVNCSSSTPGDPRNPLRRRPAEPGQVRDLREWGNPRRGDRHSCRISNVRPVECRRTQRRKPQRVVPGGGLGHAFMALEQSTVMYLCNGDTARAASTESIHSTQPSASPGQILGR